MRGRTARTGAVRGVGCSGATAPGIVAAVTRMLADADCNLEDHPDGHFAMMLVVTGPAGMDAQGLKGVLGPVAGRLDLQVSVRAVTDEVTAAAAGGARYGPGPRGRR